MSQPLTIKKLSHLNAFIQKNHQEFASVIHPEKYISAGRSYSLPYAIRYLQSRMRAALFFFVNGSYWMEGNFWRASVFCPGEGRADPQAINILLGLRFLIEAVNRRFGVFEKLYFRLKKLNRFSISNNEMTKLFATFYKEFDLISKRLTTTTIVEKKSEGVLRDADYQANDRKFLMPLFDLQAYSNRYFKEFLKGFYLHGSLATMDYIPGWSDLDTFMIVRRDTILNPQELNELRKRALQSHKYLFQIDPYQLHGHLLISEFDLDYYSETYFPIVLWDYSKSFFYENPTVKFDLRDCRLEKIAVFWSDAVHYFVTKAIEFISKGRRLNWNREKKLFIHRLLTFPLFYLQAKGVHIYKKYSFAQAESEFSDEDWAVISAATSFMNRWKYDYQSGRYLKLLENSNPQIYLLALNLIHDVMYFFVNGELKEFQRQYDKWLGSALELCTKGWNTVTKNLAATSNEFS